LRHVFEKDVAPSFERAQQAQRLAHDCNADPFIGTPHDMNLTDVMCKGGFDAAKVKEVAHPRFAPNHTGLDINSDAPTHRAGNCGIVDGVK
jgi:hypothetical protein